MTNETRSITLRRSGDAPLVFEGRLLAEASSQTSSGYRQNRWHEIEIYALAAARYVARVSYRTQWQGETGHDACQVADAPDALRWLRGYDPAAHVTGFSADEAYEERQRRLLADIRAGYAEALSDALTAANITESPETADPEAQLRAARDSRRYRRLLADAFREVRLTLPEAALICDALNGIGLSIYGDDLQARMWPCKVEDAVRLNGSDKHHGVDWPELRAKLAALTDLQKVAIADAVETWWRTADSLAAVGLINV